MVRVESEIFGATRGMCSWSSQCVETTGGVSRESSIA